MKTKDQVNYGPSATPNEQCALCRYYNRDSGRCHMVKGVILPQGCCDRFFPRQVQDVVLPS